MTWLHGIVLLAGMAGGAFTVVQLWPGSGQRPCGVAASTPRALLVVYWLMGWVMLLGCFATFLIVTVGRVLLASMRGIQ